MKVRQALMGMPTADLRGVAYNLHLSESLSAVKSELVDGVTRLLCDAGTVSRLLAQLPPRQTAALDALVLAGSRLPAYDFCHRFGTIRFSDPYQYGEQEQWRTYASVAEGLYYRGLVYRSYGNIGDWRGEFYGIADEILARLPRRDMPSLRDMLTAVAEPKRVLPQGDLLRDMGMLLCYLQRETVKPLQNGDLAKRDLVRLNEDMSLPVTDLQAKGAEVAQWISFVCHLARLQGLVDLSTDRLRPSSKAEEWMKLTRHQQTTDLWRRFAKDAGWNEMWESAVGYARHLFTGGAAVAIRQRMCTVLKELPPDTWISLQSLDHALEAHQPLFVRESIPSPDWLISEADGSHATWDHLEGPILRTFLMQSLRAFDIVRMGAADDRGTDGAIYLTKTGAILLGAGQGTIPDPAPAPITVQPNFDIIVPAETSPSVLYYLQQVAKVSKRDRASVYVISRDLLWQYFQAGKDVQNVVTLLEAASGRPLPQNIAYSLRDWAARYGEIAIEPAILLTAANDPLLAEIRANRKISVRTKDVISARTLSLAEPDPLDLVARLRKAGYSPKISKQLATTKEEQAGGPEMRIKTRDATHLVAMAVALYRLAEGAGQSLPVPTAPLSRVLSSLSPGPQRQVARLATEIVQQLASSGIEGAAEAAGGIVEDSDLFVE